MAGKTPEETMHQLIAAFNAGDVDKALSLYHPDGVFVTEPGKLAAGIAEVRAAFDEFVATKPALTIEAHETVQAGDIALYCTRWSLSATGPGGSPVSQTGTGVVVLRQRTDGIWLVAIENPWGADLVR